LGGGRGLRSVRNWVTNLDLNVSANLTINSILIWGFHIGAHSELIDDETGALSLLPLPLLDKWVKHAYLTPGPTDQRIFLITPKSEYYLISFYLLESTKRIQIHEKNLTPNNDVTKVC
jgi:hypothetical protein